MTLESLKIFCDVVRQRSFSRGASLNHVSQSAASQAVHQLEKRLGAQLIDRSKRPLTLTVAGRVYYDGCRDLVDRYLSIEAKAKSMHDDALSNIVVSSIYSVGLYDMSQYVRRFKAEFPSGTVQLDYLHPSKVFDSVVNEEADLGLLSFPRPRREIRSLPWREEPMVLVCPPGHILCERETVRLDELNGQAFIGFDNDLAIRRHVDRFLREHDVQVDITLEFDNIEAIKRAIEIGAGISILPRPTVERELTTGSLTVCPVEGLKLVRALRIIYRRGRLLTPAMKSFIQLLQSNGSAALTPSPQRVLAAAHGNGIGNGNGRESE